MPVQFLSEADHQRLNHFPAEVTSEDLFNFFLLSELDLKEVAKQRSDSSRLGFAVQLSVDGQLFFLNGTISVSASLTKRNYFKYGGSASAASRAGRLL